MAETAVSEKGQTMTMRAAILIDHDDRRLGKLMVAPGCFVIRHAGATFVRTDKAVRIRPSMLTTAVVFEQTEVYVRERLESL